MATCKYRPIGNKLIVKLEETESASPIVLIKEEDDQRCGTVLRVGKNVNAEEKNHDITEGERVWFGKFSGTELEEALYVLRAEDVLAVEEA
jgi:co-chaperonin GroES (HSP10)